MGAVHLNESSRGMTLSWAGSEDTTSNSANKATDIQPEYEDNITGICSKTRVRKVKEKYFNANGDTYD